MTDAEATDAINLALGHHQAGQFAEAEAIYRQILAALPEHADALHLLGAVLAQTDRREEGIELMRKACAVKPDAAPFHNNLGNALREVGKPADAIAEYQRAIELAPNFAEAYNNLGNAFGDLRQYPQAVEAYRAAVRLNPKLDHPFSNLGVALRSLGDLPEAVKALRQAIELNPQSSIAYDNLGISLREMGEVEAALAALEKSLQFQPNSPFAHSNYSIALRDANRLDDAIAECRKAIELLPSYPEAYNNLGVALADCGKTDEAIDAYFKALELKPTYGAAATNLGVSLADKGLFKESLAESVRAVELDPDSGMAHLNLAMIQLLTGDFEHGLAEYEWRWKCPGLLPRREFSQPRWDGSPLEGKTLLVYAEQGLGDTIQFIRYVQYFAQGAGVEGGGRIVVECDPALHRLVRQIPGVEQVAGTGDPLPPFDLHCPIVSLPYTLGATLDTIPADVPYLTPDPTLVEEWRERLEDQNVKYKIGLVWAGRPKHRNDKKRSITLADFAPLASRRINYISLQKGPAAAQTAKPPGIMRLLDPTDVLYDLADTAAAIANLDLVITVDTAIAHLAGAMGKPVWTLLPFNPDWRWLLEREDSPWYPTMRLFRQKTPGDWAEVVMRLQAALREFAKAR